MKNNSVVKFILVFIAIVFSLILIKDIFFPTGFGVGVNIQGNSSGGHMYISRNYSYGFEGTLVFLIRLLIELLFIVFTTGLIFGVVFYVKNKVFTNEDSTTIESNVLSNKQQPYKICNECGRKIDTEWKVCPHCGQTDDESVKQ